MASWFNDALSSLVNLSGASSSQPVQPDSLQADGMLSKAQLQAYFAECGAVLDDPGFRTKLKDAQLLNQDVPKVIDDMQRQILIKLGVDGDFGMACLGRVNEVYRSDEQLMASFLEYVAKEEDAMDEAEMPTSDYEQKQRLMALARAHAAQLMDKMQALPPDERAEFMQQQMAHAQRLREKVLNGEPLSTPTVARPPQGASMTRDEQLEFFTSTAGR